MPVHLPPISRRRFLTSSLAAATLGLLPGCMTKPPRRDGQSIAFLSDIHIAADPTHIARGINMTDHLKQATAEVLELKNRPDTLFINGDLAFNSGEKADYEAVVKLIRPLREAGMTTHINMGNHDDRDHLWSVMGDLKSVPANLPDRQVSIVRMPEANWFMLDSLIHTLTTPGKLGPEQLAWITRELDANQDKPAIIMVHHQPGPLSPTHRGGGLEDADELFAILRPRQQVKAYIHGHTHRWSAKQEDSGIYIINLPTVAYPFDPAMPSAWVDGHLMADGAHLQLHCLDHAHKDNGQTVNMAWRA